MNDKLFNECLLIRSNQSKKTYEELNDEYGKPYKNGESLRGHIKSILRKKNLLPTKKDVVSEEVQNKFYNIRLQEIELQKSKIKLRDERTELNKIIREQARSETTQEKFQESLNQINETRPLKVENTIKINSNNEMIAVFTDWHYGVFTDNHFNSFNKEEFHKRVELFLNEIIKKGLKNNISKLHIFEIGDMIQGNIHLVSRITNTENVIKQIQEVSETICDMLSNLGNRFQEINYYSLVGNHSRFSPNKLESLRSENMEYLIDWYLKGRLNNFKNIIFHENEDDEVINTTVCGNRIFAVHGDSDKMSNVVQNLSLMYKQFPDLILIGHMHHFAIDTIQDVQVIMSGSLSGTDDYAKSIRKVGSASQTIIIYEDGKQEGIYNIKLNN